jgi:hypothetical protein
VRRATAKACHSGGLIGSAEQLSEKVFLIDGLTAEAKASAQNKPVIALLKHCTAQNQA